MKLPDLPKLEQLIDPAVLDRLTERERRILLGGAVALGLLLVFLIVQGTVGRLDRLERRAAAARERLEKMDELIGDYRALEAEYETLLQRARAGGDPLATVVETQARRAGVAENITTVRDRAAPPADPDFVMTGVEVQIEDAPLEGLVKLMAALEQDRRSLLQFGRVRIEGQGEIGERAMDANLQVLRFEANG